MGEGAPIGYETAVLLAIGCRALSMAISSAALKRTDVTS